MYGNITNLFVAMVNRNAHAITIAKRANDIRIGSFAFWPDHHALADGKTAGTVNNADRRLRLGGLGNGKRDLGVQILRLAITKLVKRSFKRAQSRVICQQRRTAIPSSTQEPANIANRGIAITRLMPRKINTISCAKMRLNKPK